MRRTIKILANELTRMFVRPSYRAIMGKPRLGISKYDGAIPARRARRVLRANGLGFGVDGSPSWWYAALDGRNSIDELTHYELDFMTQHLPTDAAVLVTGCGIGLTTIPLAKRGFTNIQGFDYLPNVVKSAAEIAKIAEVAIVYWKADGFRPNLTQEYDCITAMHWVYSAWMGNYDNPVETRTDREAILADFLNQYAQHLKPGGVMLLELVDALLDHAYPPFDAYPVRHTAEQVRKAAEGAGLCVQTIVSNPLGQRPIVVLYVLKK